MVDLCFLYYRQTLKAVRQHWTTHHALLGLAQFANIPRHGNWKTFKLNGQPVFFTSYRTRWPEVVYVMVSVDHSQALEPKLLQDLANFLSHPEMRPAEAIAITMTESSSGPWYVLSREYPKEVFESIRFNCDDDVQQIRIIGPQFAAEFGHLAEVAAPYAVKSWVENDYLWLDFDWPCLAWKNGQTAVPLG